MVWDRCIHPCIALEKLVKNELDREKKNCKSSAPFKGDFYAKLNHRRKYDIII